MRKLPSASPLTATALEESISALTAQYPALWVTSIGRTILGRRISCLTVGRGRPFLLCVATHHAMEWICGRMLLTFAEYLLAQESVGKGHIGTYCFVPLLNPDGVELQANGYDPGCILATRQVKYNGGSVDFSHWQANARGVDLNHNYPTGFAAYRAVERELGIDGGAPTRYSGAAPLSEPETQALIAFLDTVAPDAVLTLHTQGREIYYGDSPARNTLLAAHMLGRRVGYRVCTPTGPSAYGGLTDYLCKERKIPALTVECGKGVNPLPPASFGRIYQEVFPLLFHAPRLLTKCK